MATVIKIGERGYQLTDSEAEALEELLGLSGTEVARAFATMKRDAKGPLIYPAMIKAMRAVTAVGKDGYNQQQNYPFRGIDGVLNALGPALRDAGVLPMPTLEHIQLRDTRTTQDRATREVQVRVRYTFYAEDGSSVEAVVPGESLDTSDKGTAKSMSVAFRIALLQIFALPTQEPTTDHDSEYHTRGGEPRMSRFEADAGRALLAIPTAEQRAGMGEQLAWASFVQALDFKACLDEHSSWLAGSAGNESPTWSELFTARVAAEISAADTKAEARRLWDILAERKLDFEHDGKRFSQLIRERGAAIDERNAKVLNTITEQILNAPLADLEGDDGPVLHSVTYARALDRITDEHVADLLRLMAERHQKLLRDGLADQQATHAPSEVTS